MFMPSVFDRSCLLGIFAKRPLPGEAKTRLAQATSPEWAQRVAVALLEDTLDRFRFFPVERAIAFTPGAAGEYFANLSQADYECFPQCDGDLGNRLRFFFDTAHDLGFARVVAIGTDSPTLPAGIVERAFRELSDHDVVLGPALDGGYYLIGINRRHHAPRDEVDTITRRVMSTIFDDIPWSTSGVLTETIARVEKASLRLALLPPWYDIDTADDWAMLCEHIRSMRQAGIDPEVPRLETLLNNA